ncbi:hypothetical protein BRC65_00605 [Halobacteriales archaeon QH_2_65_14]|nr:MAG: hypothetical protein BRC65_00605 [Halobacteriales archaeon QH_2_65_14]
MSLVALLRKELHWSKRNVLVVLFLVVLIPVFFAGTSLLFQDVLPRNVPVAVVAEDDSVTDEELETVAQTIDSFTNPRVAGSRQAAKRQLERESVYGIVTVPPDATTEGAEVQVTFTVDGSIVPFQSPSQVYQRLMEFYLDGLYDSDLTVEQRVDGERLDLNEYLFPTFLMAFAIFFAFTSVPYVFRREAAVMDRLRFETSLEAVVASKLVFLSTLLAGPIIVFHVANVYYGYGIDSLDPAGLAVLVLTFLLLATFATTVMVLALGARVSPGLFFDGPDDYRRGSPDPLRDDHRQEHDAQGREHHDVSGLARGPRRTGPALPARTGGRNRALQEECIGGE